MTTSYNNAVAERYAKALFSLSEEKREVDAIAADMQALLATLQSSPEFTAILANPLINKAQKAAIVQAVADSLKLQAGSAQFLRRLGLNQRLNITGAIAQYFLRLVRESKGEMEVNVRTAKKLGAAELKKIADALSKKTGKTVTIQQTEDARLLGGVVIQLGDTQIDYSLSGSLDRLHQQLKTA